MVTKHHVHKFNKNLYLGGWLVDYYFWSKSILKNYTKYVIFIAYSKK